MHTIVDLRMEIRACYLWAIDSLVLSRDSIVERAARLIRRARARCRLLILLALASSLNGLKDILLRLKLLRLSKRILRLVLDAYVLLLLLLLLLLQM